MIGGIFLPFLILIVAMLPSIFALLGLRKRDLEPLIKVIWVIVIIIFPWIGPIAFFIVSPGESE